MRKPTVQIAPWVFPLTEETASVPRMCWEKLSAVFTSCINLGSPPRVRGKDAVCTVGDAGCRITPACAGKRVPGCPPGPRRGDHPRVCGEKFKSVPEWFQSKGSPPRVRGKDSLKAFTIARKRITPACAGKRRCCRCGQTRAWDHPRVCGEKPFRTPPGRGRRGSPPRVRGKGVQTVLDGHRPGNTPACAGKRGLSRGLFRGR